MISTSGSVQSLFISLLGIGLGASVLLLAEGYKQEFYVYSDDTHAYYLYFDQPVADLTPYKDRLIPNQSICLRGLWYSYTGVNFETFNGTISGKNEGTGEKLVCVRQDANTWDSIRYQGPSDTSIDSISLYTGPVWTGEKFLITSQTQSGISASKIGSLGITGTSPWTVYEGQNLDGRAICYQGAYFVNDFLSTSAFPLTTVGSVAKGCLAPLYNATRI